jgi:hypothetical protein
MSKNVFAIWTRDYEPRANLAKCLDERVLDEWHVPCEVLVTYPERQCLMANFLGDMASEVRCVRHGLESLKG